METFNYISISISIAGSIIIIWGVLRTAVDFMITEFQVLFRKANAEKESEIRYHLGRYLLLGLDFMLAADIIHTIHKPVLTELYILAIIVAIRTVISYFLQKEIKTMTQKTN